MTLPSTSLMSAVEFNHYDTMSFSPSNSDSLLENQIYQYRLNIDALPIQQQQQHHELQQQQRSVLHNEQQQTPLQRILPTMSPLPSQQNTILQQQEQRKSAVSHAMPTTTLAQEKSLSSQCPAIRPSAPTIIPTATASASIFSTVDLSVENVMPGIYLTKNFIAWNEENLRSHGFTHIIIIDKHIQELYYPSPVFKFSTENTAVDAFDTYDYISHPACTSLKFGKEFEAIDLNFGEKSYLTTVLPNCYRAVKFINKALQGGGTILVIDCNGGEQKCITIIVAYLMYKHNINFSNAFARLKDYYKKSDLDRFYMTQLYEYEPILQVQRAQSRGQSCSREMHSAILKRKKRLDDIGGSGGDCSNNAMNFTAADNAGTSTSDFFNNFNPLSNFNATTTTSTVDINLKATTTIRSNHSVHQQQQLNATSLQQSNICQQYRDSTRSALFSEGAVGYCPAWDDNAME